MHKSIRGRDGKVCRQIEKKSCWVLRAASDRRHLQETSRVINGRCVKHRAAVLTRDMATQTVRPAQTGRQQDRQIDSRTDR